MIIQFVLSTVPNPHGFLFQYKNEPEKCESYTKVASVTNNGHISVVNIKGVNQILAQ